MSFRLTPCTPTDRCPYPSSLQTAAISGRAAGCRQHVRQQVADRRHFPRWSRTTQLPYRQLVRRSLRARSCPPRRSSSRRDARALRPHVSEGPAGIRAEQLARCQQIPTELGHLGKRIHTSGHLTAECFELGPTRCTKSGTNPLCSPTAGLRVPAVPSCGNERRRSWPVACPALNPALGDPVDMVHRS